MGPCKALAHVRAAGIREGLEGTGEFTRGRDKEGSCQEPSRGQARDLPGTGRQWLGEEWEASASLKARLTIQKIGSPLIGTGRGLG